MISQWLSMTARECWFLFRSGVAIGIIGVLSVMLFRPETPVDQVVMFVLVPLGFSYLAIRVLFIVATHLGNSPPPVVQVTIRVRILSWCIFLFMLMAIIGIPSIAVYGYLGMGWASGFVSREILVSLSAIASAAIMAGPHHVPLARFFRRAMNFLFVTRLRSRKLAHC
jgi:hypothetical protein